MMSARAQQRIGHFADEAAAPQRTIDDDVERALRDLPRLELQVLRERFGALGRPRPWREVARRLGLSLSRVRRLERQALGDLRALSPPKVPRRRPHPEAPNVSRSGEANRPRPWMVEDPLPRPPLAGAATPKTKGVTGDQ
jgi:hypothetical protein